MRIGLMIEGQEGLTWDGWLRYLRAVEGAGFDSFWRSDHLVSLYGPERRDALETWVSLAVAARETQRIRFGPLVCSMTFRHPAMLARMAAQVHVLSAGRLELGVGAGHIPREHEAFGIPYPSLGERLDLLDEGIQVMRGLWRDGPASFNGRYFQLERAECYPKPLRGRLSLMIGGVGERRTLRLVARYADHWNAFGLTPEQYARKRAVLEDRCAEIDRDPGTIHRSIICGFITGKDEAEVAAHEERLRRAVPKRMENSGAEALSAPGQGAWLVGTPPRVIEKMLAFERAGVQEVIFQHFDLNGLEMVDFLSSEILPHVRAGAAG